VDITRKVILGGTLTNWPAQRDGAGKVKLRPIELSSQYQIVEVLMSKKDEPVVETITTPTTPTAPATPPVPSFTELMTADPALANQVREFVTAQVKAGIESSLAQMKRDAHIAEFCAGVIGGTDETPKGLPIESNELATFLGSLSDPQRAEAEKLLTKIHANGLVEFAERGHGKTLKGKTPLPDWAKQTLAEYISGGGTLEKFFEINAVDFGDMGSYDLSAYTKKEK
jgi:hypothetical protein